MIIKIISKILPVVSVTLLLSITTYGGDDIRGKKADQPTVSKMNKIQSSGKVGDAYRLFINNVNLPMNRAGALAEVNIPDPNPIISGSGGKFAGDVALFAAGFFLSGLANGNMFVNAVAPASLVQDYVHGDVATGQTNPNAQLYVLKLSDEPFGQSWIDWKDAVDLGADFYDGDNDGVYNPTDKNGNGLWDVDEDRPDLIGDETVWCVYSDLVPTPQRRWNTVPAQGIEIRQTVFAFASGGAIGNIIFVRYRFKYVGLGNANEPNALEDCYFGVWADPDMGDAYDDLMGCDVPRNAGFVYNDGPDINPAYGTQPPAFLIDFFQGPLSYIAGETYTDVNGNGVYDDGVDTPLDTAYSVRGLLKGIVSYPGAKNLGLSSYVMYKNGDPVINDPANAAEARRYTLGQDKNGDSPNPCTFSYGEVVGGVDCNTIDPRYWFSGDPVARTGWICSLEGDYRMMANTGPFTLTKGDEKEIVVAYVFGQGTDALNSVTVAKGIDDGAQDIFDNNFIAPSSPPAVEVETSSGEDFIDLQWNTKDQVSYQVKTSTYDLKFKGYQVFAFKSNSTSEEVSGQENQKLIQTYQLDDFINNLYKENDQTGGIEMLYPASPNKLDYATYTNDETGRIRLRITQDPFTGSNLVKGKPYFFAVTSYAVNHDALVNKLVDTTALIFGDYYLSAGSFVAEVENVPKIFTVQMAQDEYNPPSDLISVETKGGSGAILNYDVVEKQSLTGDNYKVTFKIDSVKNAYTTWWKLENITKGTTLRDTVREYLGDDPTIAKIPTDGFIVKLPNKYPAVGELERQTSTNWLNSTASRVYYVASDSGISQKISSLSGLSTLNGKYIRADKLRRVEIKFGESGKAYRYINGYKGSALQRRNSYAYAEGILAADTVGKGPIGLFGVGFVDIPFTVWVEDLQTETGGFGEKRQLTVGFIEKARADGGRPDGIWDPSTSIDSTGEFILIFDATYDPAGNQQIYKGGFVSGTTTVWADLRGGSNYNIPAGAPVTDDERKIAASPYFNTLYVAALQRANNTDFYASGDKVIIPVATYPYTPKDEYTFQTVKGGALTEEEEKSLFQRVNVFPNPMYGFNVATGYTGTPSDEPFVTFSNLPEEVTIKIYSLSGNLIRTLDQNDKTSPTSPFLNWDLQNESAIRVASGLYLAIVSSPKYGDKVLKFSIIMPQKQLQRY
jgi:hypothetical protein